MHKRDLEGHSLMVAVIMVLRLLVSAPLELVVVAEVMFVEVRVLGVVVEEVTMVAVADLLGAVGEARRIQTPH